MAKELHQKRVIRIPFGFDPDTREQIAEDIIEHIKDRTESGVGFKDGKDYRFPKYSKQYINSTDFKNAGKSAGSVDLTLSGDMLASIELLNHGDGFLLIGFEKGSEENAKADGNIRGTYGGKMRRNKARPFLGITRKDLKEILGDYESKRQTS